MTTQTESYLPLYKTAEVCGITVERLKQLALRKDRPKNFQTEDGFYRVTAVQSLLKHIAAQRRHAHRAAEKKRLAKQQSSAANSAVRPVEQSSGTKAITFEEYRKQFWRTNDHWQNLLRGDISPQTISLVDAALHFGIKSFT